MKDRQAPQAQAQLRIPILSILLHGIAMTALVYLRTGFGYAFLKPKSVFFAFSWALLLFAIYSWIEPGMWAKNSLLCMFGIGASLLYTLHLSNAFGSELRGTARHDNHSGTPHVLHILNLRSPDEFRLLWVLWAEPTLVLVAAILVRWPLGASNLSTWLFLVAPCMWLKEALNFWLQIRQRKRHRDSMEDAEDGFDTGHVQPDLVNPAQSRKDKVRRNRAP